MTLSELEKELRKIKARNKRVEGDKAWETSWTRRCLIIVLTYLVIVIFFIFADLPNPFINAIVPAVAFGISTLTIPLIKTWWIKHIYKNK